MLQIAEVVTRLHVWSSSTLLSCSESRSPRGATGTENNLNNSAVQLRVNHIDFTTSFPLSLLKDIIIIIVMVMMKIHTYSITDMEESFNQFRCRDLPKDPTRDPLVLVQYWLRATWWVLQIVFECGKYKIVHPSFPKDKVEWLVRYVKRGNKRLLLSKAGCLSLSFSSTSPPSKNGFEKH